MRIVVDFPTLTEKEADEGSELLLVFAQAMLEASSTDDFLIVVDGSGIDRCDRLRRVIATWPGGRARLRPWECPKSPLIPADAPRWVRAALIVSLDAEAVFTTDPCMQVELDEQRESRATTVLVHDERTDRGTPETSLAWDEAAREIKFRDAAGPSDPLDAAAIVAAIHARRASLCAKEAAPRRRLAYVSPLPPIPSGIADHSELMLVGLGEFYAVEAFVAQEEISERGEALTYPTRSHDAFLREAASFDRVVYNFGNSPFHCHMVPMLQSRPGVIDLHDFYLGDLRRAVFERYPSAENAFSEQLFRAHGYAPTRAAAAGATVEDIVREFPTNSELLEQGLGVVAHSEYARRLGATFLGHAAADDWAVVPLPRKRLAAGDRHAIRARIGYGPNDIIFCSFGFVSENKLPERIVDAWLRSSLAADGHCRLLFVGEVAKSNYGEHLRQRLTGLDPEVGIKLVGRCSPDEYDDFLRIADAAVQLRQNSRGETSAAILDCMNAGIPVIANANGSAADLPGDVALLLPDHFSVEELVAALEQLSEDRLAATAMAERARHFIDTGHRIAPAAAAYRDALERFHTPARLAEYRLLERLGRAGFAEAEPADLEALAASISRTFPRRAGKRALFVDVSAICRHDVHTGIQRVVRAIAASWLAEDHDDFTVLPVYLSDGGGRWAYRHARRWTSHLLGLPAEEIEDLDDARVDFTDRDSLVILDFTGPMLYETEDRERYFTDLKNHGVTITCVVYDILPLKFPKFFPLIAADHKRWLGAVCNIADRIMCISDAVADDVRGWIASHVEGFGPEVDYFHLGADITNSRPTTGLPSSLISALECLRSRTTFLMVGTIEPRKGQAQTLDAFDLLWSEGLDLNLVIVGKLGWMSDRLKNHITDHPRRDCNLFWFSDISDEALLELYGAADCLIAASRDEGFGLPLIEAAQKGVPILARDITVFREVAGSHASYFQADDERHLASAIKAWLDLFSRGEHPRSDEMPWLTWKESAAVLLAKVQAAQVSRDRAPQKRP